MSLRHRHEYAAAFPRGLPSGSCPPPQKFPDNNRRVRTAPGPDPPGFEPVSHKGSVTRRFLAYSSPSRLPDPNHLAVLARPGVVRAAPTLPAATRIRLPPAPPSCCDRISGEGLSPPLEPQRLTAHPRPSPRRGNDADRRRSAHEAGLRRPRPRVDGLHGGRLRRGGGRTRRAGGDRDSGVRAAPEAPCCGWCHQCAIWSRFMTPAMERESAPEGTNSLVKQRRLRDLNPRWALDPNRISSAAP